MQTIETSQISIAEILFEASIAANAAGENWLKNAKPCYEFFSSDLENNRTGPSTYMLDQCGSAYIKFRDKRKKEFKMFEKAGFIRYDNVINIDYRFRGRQEHGLKVACMEAAFNILTKYGIKNVRLCDYID